MKRLGVMSALLTGITGSLVMAGSPNAAEIFRAKCQLCHATRQVTPAQREKLLGPPIDEVMLRVKEKYPIREDAIRFIADYIRAPRIDRALCPSLDRYGLMPSLEKTLTQAEAEAVAGMLFDSYPRSGAVKKPASDPASRKK